MLSKYRAYLFREEGDNVPLAPVEVLLVEASYPGCQHVLPAEQVVVAEHHRVHVNVQLVTTLTLDRSIYIPAVKLLGQSLKENTTEFMSTSSW